MSGIITKKPIRASPGIPTDRAIIENMTNINAEPASTMR